MDIAYCNYIIIRLIGAHSNINIDIKNYGNLNLNLKSIAIVFLVLDNSVYMAVAV